MRKLLLLIFTGLLFTTQGISQVTTEGTEFWLGFMQNSDGGAPSSLEVFITSKVEANVEIFVYTDGSTRTVTVTPGITHQEFISISTNNPYAAVESGNIERKAIRITSDADISVYAFNNRQRSADATVVLPSRSLGKEYFVSSYWEDAGNDNSASEFLVVATQNDTDIVITPSENTLDGRRAGVPYSITLNQGDIYQVQAEADLTGSFINASQDSGDCKNFAVFGGNQWGIITMGQDCSTGNGANPGGYAPDHLLEQMYPTNTWGRNYVAFPFELRRNYGLRIIASEDETAVTIGGDVITLDAGEYETFILDELIAIDSDKPVQVAQFSFSLSCDNNSITGSGDPFMMMLNPNEQQLQEINFNALNATELDNYFLTIITDTDNVNNVLLNGSQLSAGEFQEVPGANQFSYGNFDIQKANDYNLTSDGGFVAYIYAFGNIESFGYVAGASLENLNLQAQGDDEFIDIIAEQACLNAEIDFTALFETPQGQEPQFNTFDWDFGDGTVAQGQGITKVFAEPGSYDIVLTASDGQGSCGTSATVFRTIEVVPTEVSDINGASSVCPDVFGIEYSVIGNAGNSYEWTVVGGTIAQDNGTSILVDWGAPNPNASVTVAVKNSIGCEIDDLVLDVVVNKLLEPVAAFSDSFIAPGTLLSEVCFENRNRDRYYVNPTNGSSYVWQIEGGVFLGGNTGDSVEVDWGNSASGRIWYTESNDLIPDCEGVSDILEVVVYQPLEVTPTINNVLCNGEANGEISLAITGGKPGDYQITWDNGMTGADINGLIAGDYTVTISDEVGCELIETLTVTEPDVLAVIGDPQTLPVRCFQESNGVADITVTGGTTFPNGNYQFRWESADYQETTMNNVNTSLPDGDYNVIITDANGCQTSTSFTITEPPLLEPDLETLINETICPQANDGVAFIDAKGGTPDYQFFWSNKPNIDDRNASDLSAGEYTVRIVDSNGCETNYVIQVEERLPKIFIPNAFSPDDQGDPLNNEFKPVASCGGQYFMQLYNKWGSIVFSTEDLTEGWDGTYRGTLAPVGEYSYVIFYANTVNGVSFEDTYRGSFKLIR